MVPQEKATIRSSSLSRRHHELLEVAEDASDSSSSCSVESTRRTTHRPNKAPLDSVTQHEEDPASSSMQKSVKKSTTREATTSSGTMSLTSLLRLALPPVEHVVLEASASSSLRTATGSSNVCCSPVAVVDDASVSDISTGSCAQGSPRSIFKAYWDKSGELAPPLMRSTSASSTTASSSMSSSTSSVPLHVGGSLASPRPFQDPSRLDYEDSLLLTKEETTPTTQAAASVPPQQENEDLSLRRRSIIGQHGYRSNSEPSLCLHAVASRSSPTATMMTPTSLACFFAPFRKTRSASTLHDHHKAASSSIGAPSAGKSCLRRGRFSSSSFGDMTTSSKIQSSVGEEPSSSPSSPVLSDAGSVTFNEDDNRVVVFHSPRELWSQRGWSDYFAC